MIADPHLLTVYEGGTALEIGFADLMKYHGSTFPGGVAHAYRAMIEGLALFDPVQRREVHVRTAFPGPEGRDAIEMALRAVTDGRFTVDRALGAPERGPTLAH
ncbi:hypothetical protein ACLQ3K_09915 [Tsukamurella sp. DT100]|uniref:hypothetical protein n=1 Tax=Tsukamurella sp. DT100 TaxID=3393415 RepID=UPI003CF6DC6A